MQHQKVAEIEDEPRLAQMTEKLEQLLVELDKIDAPVAALKVAEALDMLRSQRLLDR